MAGLSRNLSAGDIEILEYCFYELHETMEEGKRQRLQNMISDLKCKEEGEGRQEDTAGRNIRKAYIVPGL